MVLLRLGHVSQSAVLADGRPIVSDIIQLNIFYGVAIDATSSVADSGVSLYLNGRDLGDPLLRVTAKSAMLVLHSSTEVSLRSDRRRYIEYTTSPSLAI